MTNTAKENITLSTRWSSVLADNSNITEQQKRFDNYIHELLASTFIATGSEEYYKLREWALLYAPTWTSDYKLFSDELKKEFLRLFGRDVSIDVDKLDDLHYDIYCNICGKQFDYWDYSEHFEINTICGYGSTHDMEEHHVRLCCECFDKLVDNCKVTSFVKEHS
jgi:hypothetical protein